MAVAIDGSLYPDVPPPRELATLADQMEFVARVCGAWDFGIIPRAETLLLLRDPAMHMALDAQTIGHSPSYHALRTLARLPSRIEGCRTTIRARYELDDEAEGRPPDTLL